MQWIDPPVGGEPGAGLVTVANIAALKAITPTAGAAVWVEGYTTPGDGGGGLFRAALTGALGTDGGLVFGATADEAVGTPATGLVYSQIGAGYSPHTDLVWGTVVVESEDPAATQTFPDLILHGHRRTPSTPLVGKVDHKTGVVRDADNRIQTYITDNSLSPQTIKITYKYFTNARRWVRVWDGKAVDVRWFGAQEGANARNQIGWALTAAKRAGAKEVRLNGSYRYRLALEVPDGVTFGWGKLTVIDENLASTPKVGPMIWFHNSYRTTWYPQGEAEVWLAGNESPDLGPESGAMFWGLKQLELDGNYQNVTDYYTTPANYTGSMAPNPPTANAIEELLQNTTVYGGWNNSAHGGRVTPFGQVGRVDDVHIHGYGSNCFLGHAYCTVISNNLKLGNSIRNHLFYSAPGVHTGLVFYGFAWGSYGKTEHGEFYGFQFINPAVSPVPVGRWPSGTNPNAHQIWLYEGNRRPAGGVAVTSYRWDRRIGLSFRDVHIELGAIDAGGASPSLQGPMFYLTGPHFLLDGCVVIGRTVNTLQYHETALAAESVIGSEAEFMEDWHFKNIEMRQRGHPMSFNSNNDFQSTYTVKNFTVIDDYGYEGVADAADRRRGALVNLRLGHSGRTGTASPGLTAGRQLVYDRVRMLGEQNWLLNVDVLTADAPRVDLTIRNSQFDKLMETGHIVTPAGTGAISALTVDTPEKIRVVFDTVAANWFPGSSWENTEAFLALCELRNCRDLTGRQSEVEQIYTATGGETQVDIQPGLLWAPKVFACDGPVRWTSMTVRNSANSAALTSTINEDKRNPYLRIVFASALSAGQRFVIRAAMGGRGAHHLTTVAR